MGLPVGNAVLVANGARSWAKRPSMDVSVPSGTYNLTIPDENSQRR